MARTVLSRYLDAEILSHIAGRRIEPRGLVIGNLAGSHRSPLSGFAVEFAGHRQYVPGDDPKYIDWRVYYRRERYVVKQFEMETNLVCHLVLDASASMRYGEGPQQKLRYAEGMLAALAHAVLRQSDKVSLAVVDDRVRSSLPPSNSMSQILRMSELLDAIEPTAKTELPRCLLELSARMTRRQIVFVFSDFFTDLEPLESALQRFRYQKHEVVLFQVLHHDELHFPLSGLARFVGLESAEALLAQPEEIRRGYLAAFKRFDDRFESLCQRNRIERVVVDTSLPVAQVLLDYLNHRNRLRRAR